MSAGRISTPEHPKTLLHWERLAAGLVLGSEAFARRLYAKTKANAREQPALRRLERRLDWGEIVLALEQTKGEPWDQFNGRHGDWGRDAALWLGRKRGRYTLSEPGQLAGGMDYAAVDQGRSRFGKRLQQSAALRKALAEIERHLSNVET